MPEARCQRCRRWGAAAVCRFCGRALCAVCSYGTGGEKNNQGGGPICRVDCVPVGTMPILSRQPPRVWSRRLLTCIVAALLGLGCNFKYKLSGPSSDVEGALVSLTAEYAARLGVNVRGEIVTNLSKAQEAQHQDPAGFYARGIAYYYRPLVEQHVTLIDGDCPAAPRCELAQGVAAHEVCHAKSFFHDTTHWCCMRNLGVRPTYPPPVAPGGQWPAC